jgi:hypothetical protein
MVKINDFAVESVRPRTSPLIFHDSTLTRPVDGRI